MQEESSANMVAGSVINRMDFRQLLSTGLAALPADVGGRALAASPQ
jgi:hypothetical protein